MHRFLYIGYFILSIALTLRLYELGLITIIPIPIAILLYFLYKIYKSYKDYIINAWREYHPICIKVAESTKTTVDYRPILDNASIIDYPQVEFPKIKKQHVIPSNILDKIKVSDNIISHESSSTTSIDKLKTMSNMQDINDLIEVLEDKEDNKPLVLNNDSEVKPIISIDDIKSYSSITKPSEPKQDFINILNSNKLSSFKKKIYKDIILCILEKTHSIKVTSKVLQAITNINCQEKEILIHIQVQKIKNIIDFPYKEITDVLSKRLGNEIKITFGDDKSTSIYDFFLDLCAFHLKNPK